jgi:hypothetical protein
MRARAHWSKGQEFSRRSKINLPKRMAEVQKLRDQVRLAEEVQKLRRDSHASVSNAPRR